MTATTPASSFIKQSFSSHDNVVEIRLDIEDAKAFVNAASNSDDMRRTFTRFMCKPERLVYIQKGIVFHHVTTGPDSGHSFDFVIDENACSSLSKPIPADAASLTRVGLDLSRRLKATLPASLSVPGLHLDSVTAKEGLVKITYRVGSAALVEQFKQKQREKSAITQGWFCANAGDEIRRGIRLEVEYRLEDGQPILDVPIDGSVC